MKKTLLGLICLFALTCAFGAAQAKGQAYTVGETLSYEAKLDRKFLPAISVADLNFVVQAAPNNNFVLKSDANSKGSIVKLLGLKFTQTIDTTIDGKTLSVLKTVRHDEQGDRVRDSEADFDFKENKVTYVETDPKDRMQPPRTIASPISAEMQDMVSSIYTLRRLALGVGKTFEINLSDSGLVYKVPVRVTARERQESINGKVWCFRVEPEVFGTGRLIEQKGSMIIWITDDARRIPVASDIYTGIGKIEVRIKKMQAGTAPKVISGK
jgi:Protein of unknown function (DUF3108)